jgi:chemotaxis regulatin CheY-phosphate phosphatase CheZ
MIEKPIKKLTKAQQQHADYVLETTPSAAQQLNLCLNRVLGACDVIQKEAQHLFSEVNNWKAIHRGQTDIIRNLNAEIETLKQQLADKTNQENKR